MKKDQKKIGEMLIEAGLIDQLQLSSALGEQREWGGRLCSILVKRGFVDENSIVSVLEKQIGEKCISLTDREIPREVLEKVKVTIAKKYCVFPVAFDKSGITLAMPDPTDLNIVDELSFVLNARIRPVLAMESNIRDAIALHYEGAAPKGKTFQRDRQVPSETRELPQRTGQVQPPDAPSEPETPTERPQEKKQVAPKAALDALIALLTEKGVITREELMRKIEKR